MEAIRAGSDLIEICHSAELILRTYEALIAEAEKSAAFRDAAARQRRESGAQARAALRRRSASCAHRAAI